MFNVGDKLRMKEDYNDLRQGDIVFFVKAGVERDDNREDMRLITVRPEEPHDKATYDMHAMRVELIEENKIEKNEMTSYQWVDTKENKAKVLVQTKNGEDRALAYIIIKPLKARILQAPELFPSIESIIDYDWKMNVFNRVAPNDGYNSVSEGMEAIERQLKIIQVNGVKINKAENNLLNVLLQLKNLEIFGKIELVIRVEGLDQKISEVKK
jgi:hypothetical protein